MLPRPKFKNIEPLLEFLSDGDQVNLKEELLQLDQYIQNEIDNEDKILSDRNTLPYYDYSKFIDYLDALSKWVKDNKLRYFYLPEQVKIFLATRNLSERLFGIINDEEVKDEPVKKPKNNQSKEKEKEKEKDKGKEKDKEKEKQKGKSEKVIRRPQPSASNQTAASSWIELLKNPDSWHGSYAELINNLTDDQVNILNQWRKSKLFKSYYNAHFHTDLKNNLKIRIKEINKAKLDELIDELANTQPQSKQLLNLLNLLNNDVELPSDISFFNLTPKQLLMIHHWIERNPDLDILLPNRLLATVRRPVLDKLIRWNLQPSDQIRKIDFSQSLKFKDKLFLSEFLKENPTRNFFPSGYYLHNGVIFYLSHHLKRHVKKLSLEDKEFHQVKFKVLEEKPLSRGGYGFIFECAKTLSLMDKGLSETNDHKHLVKMAAETLNNAFIFNDTGSIKHTSKKSIVKELYFQERGKRFHTKTLMKQKEADVKLYLMQFRKFPDQTLHQLLSSKEESSSYNVNLSYNDKLRINLSLLRGYKEQVDKFKWVHSDIKPINIIVSSKHFNEDVRSNFVDFGFSFKAKNSKSQPTGTKGFVAPEVRNKESNTSKSDIYSLGATSAIIWGVDTSSFPKDIHKWSKTDWENYYKLIGESLVYDEEKKILPIIKKMLAEDPLKRPTIDNVIDEFMTEYIAHNFPKATDKKQLKNSYNLGMQFREVFTHIKFDNDGFAELSKWFKGTSFKNIPNKLNHIQLFLEGLDWAVLKGLNTKDEIMSKARTIYEDYQNLEYQYISLVSNAKDQLSQTQDQLECTQLESFIADISTKLEKIRNTDFNLDTLNEINQTLQSKYYLYKVKLLSLSAKDANEFIQLVNNESDNKVNIQELSKALGFKQELKDRDSLISALKVLFQKNTDLVKKYKSLLEQVKNGVEHPNKESLIKELTDKINKQQLKLALFDFAALHKDAEKKDEPTLLKKTEVYLKLGIINQLKQDLTATKKTNLHDKKLLDWLDSLIASLISDPKPDLNGRLMSEDNIQVLKTFMEKNTILRDLLFSKSFQSQITSDQIKVNQDRWIGRVNQGSRYRNISKIFFTDLLKKLSSYDMHKLQSFLLTYQRVLKNDNLARELIPVLNAHGVSFNTRSTKKIVVSNEELKKAKIVKNLLRYVVNREKTVSPERISILKKAQEIAFELAMCSNQEELYKVGLNSIDFYIDLNKNHPRSSLISHLEKIFSYIPDKLNDKQRALFELKSNIMLLELHVLHKENAWWSCFNFFKSKSNINEVNQLIKILDGMWKDSNDNVILNQTSYNEALELINSLGESSELKEPITNLKIVLSNLKPFVVDIDHINSL